MTDDSFNIKKLNTKELLELSQEVRQKIISTCLKNGGHLGASLGAVEIAIALHRVFNSPVDSIIWDVGHQAYAHKIITDRWTSFDTLRTYGGLSGFLTPKESPHDVFGAGHSSTAISAALGMSYKNKNWTIAVVGDGALSAGLAFEGLLNSVTLQDRGPLLIVINDNQQSISQNVSSIRSLLATENAQLFFSCFNTQYVGPLDGNNLDLLLGTINGIKHNIETNVINQVVILHVYTQKGKGYFVAEERPTAYHGVGPAVISKTKTEPDLKPKENHKTWSQAVSEMVFDRMKADPKVVVITPAMTEGSELIKIQNSFPDRFFDVGIAEQHAVTFSAGLAAKGFKPYVFIYSTFMQRALDQLIHDVAIQNLPVVFLVDRAGLVGQDGPTHHGVFDLVYTTMIPGLSVFSPQNGADLKQIFKRDFNFPTVIRFPRGICEETDFELKSTDESKNTHVVSIGCIGIKIEKILLKYNLKNIKHTRLIQVKPIEKDFLNNLVHEKINNYIFFEDGVGRGSVSEYLIAKICEKKPIKAKIYAIPDQFIEHGKPADLEKLVGQDEVTLQKILSSPV